MEMININNNDENKFELCFIILELVSFIEIEDYFI